MNFVRSISNVITLLSIVLLFAVFASAELRKSKKVRCHPSCCPKPKQPKSLIGRYVLDVADGSEDGGDDFFDLVYVLMKIAKGTYNEFSTEIPHEDRKRHANETMYQEYRYSNDNMIPTNPINYNMLDATKRSAVRTRYAPGNGIANILGGNLQGTRTAGRTGLSLFRGITPQFNFDRNTFLGLNVSTQAAMAELVHHIIEWFTFLAIQNTFFNTNPKNTTEIFYFV